MKYPWEMTSDESRTILNDLMTKSARERGLGHDDVLFVYRMFQMEQGIAANRELEIQKRNAKIRDISMELTDLKRKK